MPHADSSLVPEDIKTKSDFYAHIHEQLLALLEGSRYWVSNLAQVSSLLYHAYLSSPLYGIHPESSHTPVVNWVGFYHLPLLLPPLSTPSTPSKPSSPSSPPTKLTLGPFHGRPACVHITPTPGKGVCADAYTQRSALIVPDVEAYPGHIACDGETKSEIVLPLTIPIQDRTTTIGVFDLDSTVLGTFDEDDRTGLQRIVEIVVQGSDWQ